VEVLRYFEVQQVEDLTKEDREVRSHDSILTVDDKGVRGNGLES
jgi:hypothetical protein